MITTKNDYDKQKNDIASGNSDLGHINGSNEELLTIDWNTREILIPESFETIAVFGDHMAERLYFKCARYFDDKDLGGEDITFGIVFLNSENAYGKDYAVDVKAITSEDGDDEVIFAWELKDEATRVSGDLTFAIQAYTVNDEGKITYRLNTKPTMFTVDNTLNYIATPSEPSTGADVTDGLAARIALLEKNLWEISKGDNGVKAVTLELAADVEKRFGELTSLSLTLPTVVGEDYEAMLSFTSGATATAFTYPDEIKWSGSDVYDGIFAPVVNERYTISFWHDGVYMNAVARGVEV